jgi:hypothetical protein
MGLFNFGKKKKVSEDIGERTLMPWEVPGGQEYLEINKGRASGKGVGYRPEILSGTTSAYAKQRRGALEGYELPAIASGASARGLGRSSVVTSQIGRAEQEAGRDIESRVAEMALADENKRREEMQQAIQNLGSWTQMGVGASTARAGEATARKEMYMRESARKKAEEDAFRNKLIATGGAIGSPLLSLIPGAGPILGGMAKSGVNAYSGGQGNYGSMADIDSMLNSLGASTVSMNRSPQEAPYTSWFGGQYNLPTRRQLARPGATTRIRPGSMSFDGRRG